jgi:hypothetical protein
VALINHQSRHSIFSFSYFQNAIEEVRELQMSAEYWRHLQMRVDRLEQQWAQVKAAAAKCAPARRNQHGPAMHSPAFAGDPMLRKASTGRSTGSWASA